jgi:hypothetical protein
MNLDNVSFKIWIIAIVAYFKVLSYNSAEEME